MSIAKIKSNHSARATLQYAVGKRGAQVIGGNAVPWVERNQLSDDQLGKVVATATRKLLVSIDLNDRVKRGVGHTSISFPYDEHLNDEQLSEYCEKYLAAMILTAGQPALLKTLTANQFADAVETFRSEELPKYTYTIVRHTDEPHPHAHLVYSRVNLETGLAISNSFERYRSQEILRDLERQYQLEVVPNSWDVGHKAQSISQIQKESQTGEVSVQKRLQDILDGCGRASNTVLQFIQNAQAQGVEVRMSFTRTGKSKGISYCLDGVGISGNALGTHYSFKDSDPGLVKHFNLDYEPLRDNAQIQWQCQQKPLTHDEQQQIILRDELATNLECTAAAIQQLDFSPPTSASTSDATGEPGRAVEPDFETANHDRRGSAPTAPDSDATGTSSARHWRVDQRFEPPHLPSRRSDRRADKPARGRTDHDLPTEGPHFDTGDALDQVEQQLGAFDRNSERAIWRLNFNLANLDRDLTEWREQQRLAAQMAAGWVEEILPIVQALFEYYMAQEPEVEGTSGTQQDYWVEVGQTEYQISYDSDTGCYNLQCEATGLDLQAGGSITNQDLQNWRSIREWLAQERQTTVELPAVASSAPPVLLTLEQADSLTAQEWLELTPRQQITLVEAAREHQQTEPKVYAQVEQWLGQEAQLQRHLKEGRDQYKSQKKALQELEERGQRSLFNPMGVSEAQLRDAREQLQTTERAWNREKAEYDSVQKRKHSRQQQEGSRQEWANQPETVGMQHILTLLQQAEVKAQYEAVERWAELLKEWRKEARAIGRSQEYLDKVEAVRQGYLDGEEVPQEAIEARQRDLSEYQKRQKQQQRQLEP